MLAALRTVRDDHASALARGDALEAKSASERERADRAKGQLDDIKSERDRLKAELAAAPQRRIALSLGHTPVHPVISFLVLLALLIASIALVVVAEGSR